MKSQADPRATQRLREIVGAVLGLHFDEGRTDTLARALLRRAAATGLSEEGYVERIAVRTTSEEIEALARELTIGETYFFRNAEQFHAFAERVLPELLTARAPTGRLRILSAGCASGEEPLTLRMLVQEHAVASSWDVDILGVDVNPAALQIARRGRFSTWALRETPAESRLRWFRATGGDYLLDDGVRGKVRFERRNLAEDDPTLWGSGIYDVVFCRNVLMYMTTAAAQGILQRIIRSITPGGYLFLGHAETLGGSSRSLELCQTHGSFYYRRRDAVASLPPSRWSGVALATAADAVDSTEWRSVIERSSARIDQLEDERRRPAGTSAQRARADAPSVLERVMALLQEERFADALGLLGDGAGVDEPPDRLLLRAALFAHAGRLEDALAACARLRLADPLDAGALFVIALCREGSGDDADAEIHYRLAARRDPSFAMAQLHLARLSRKAGRKTARAELDRALRLLQAEKAARIALFGGGFSREALLEMCRVELGNTGGKP